MFFTSDPPCGRPYVCHPALLQVRRTRSNTAATASADGGKRGNADERSICGGNEFVDNSFLVDLGEWMVDQLDSRISMDKHVWRKCTHR